MLYSEICEKLKKAGIENPTFEASVLLEKFCNVSRAELPFLGKKNFESDALMTALERRVSHEPRQFSENGTFSGKNIWWMRDVSFPEAIPRSSLKRQLSFCRKARFLRTFAQEAAALPYQLLQIEKTFGLLPLR